MRDATAAVAPYSAAHISGVLPYLCHAAARMHEGHAAQVGLGMQGEENKMTKGVG